MTNYKPFNLKEAIAGKPLITRDGRDVKFVGYVPEASELFKIIVYIDGMPNCTSLGVDGKYTPGESNEDVFMKSQKQTVWVNFYSNTFAYYYLSEEEANLSSSKKRIGGKAYPVEIDV